MQSKKQTIDLFSNSWICKSLAWNNQVGEEKFKQFRWGRKREIGTDLNFLESKSLRILESSVLQTNVGDRKDLKKKRKKGRRIGMEIRERKRVTNQERKKIQE